MPKNKTKYTAVVSLKPRFEALVIGFPFHSIQRYYNSLSLFLKVCYIAFYQTFLLIF